MGLNDIMVLGMLPKFVLLPLFPRDPWNHAWTHRAVCWRSTRAKFCSAQGTFINRTSSLCAVVLARIGPASSLKRRALQLSLFFLYADTLLCSGSCLFFRDGDISCGPTMQHVKDVQTNGSGERICLFHSPLFSLTVL